MNKLLFLYIGVVFTQLFCQSSKTIDPKPNVQGRKERNNVHQVRPEELNELWCRLNQTILFEKRYNGRIVEYENKNISIAELLEREEKKNVIIHVDVTNEFIYVSINNWLLNAKFKRLFEHGSYCVESVISPNQKVYLWQSSYMRRNYLPVSEKDNLNASNEASEAARKARDAAVEAAKKVAKMQGNHTIESPSSEFMVQSFDREIQLQSICQVNDIQPSVKDAKDTIEKSFIREISTAAVSGCGAGSTMTLTIPNFHPNDPGLYIVVKEMREVGKKRRVWVAYIELGKDEKTGTQITTSIKSIGRRDEVEYFSQQVEDNKAKELNIRCSS